jgi:hypothetical protein
MVEVPDRVVAERVIDEALEYGEFGDVYDIAHEGPHGQHEFETDWSLSDIDTSNCRVDMLDEETVVITDEITATYSVQTSRATYYPNSKAHPAEYETREITLHVTIENNLSNLEPPVINVEAC